MAKKKSSSNRNVVNLSGLSFVAVLLVGMSLLAAFILKQIGSDSLLNVARTVERIGLAIAILVPVILSYRWAKHSKQWVFVLWIIAVIIVIAFYVLSFFNF